MFQRGLKGQCPHKEVLMSTEFYTLHDFEEWLRKECHYTARAANEAMRWILRVRKGEPPKVLNFKAAQNRKAAIAVHEEWVAMMPPGACEVPEPLKGYHARAGGGPSADNLVKALLELLTEVDPEKAALDRGGNLQSAWLAFVKWDRGHSTSGRPKKEDAAMGMYDWLLSFGLSHSTAVAQVAKVREVLREAKELGVTPEDLAGERGPYVGALARFRAFKRGDNALPAKGKTGRAPVEDGLDAFVAWLLSKRYSESTIRGVRMDMRKILREAESTGKTCREVTLPMVTSTERQRRYAWHRYIEYANATKDPVAAETVRVAMSGLFK